MGFTVYKIINYMVEVGVVFFLILYFLVIINPSACAEGCLCVCVFVCLSVCYPRNLCKYLMILVC